MIVVSTGVVKQLRETYALQKYIANNKSRKYLSSMTQKINYERVCCQNSQTYNIANFHSYRTSLFKGKNICDVMLVFTVFKFLNEFWAFLNLNILHNHNLLKNENIVKNQRSIRTFRFDHRPIIHFNIKAYNTKLVLPTECKLTMFYILRQRIRECGRIFIRTTRDVIWSCFFFFWWEDDDIILHVFLILKKSVK